jgi:hypothetical protein
MVRCTSCTTELPENSRFCLTCGANITASNPNEAATVAMSDLPMTPTSGTRARSSASAALEQERFPPGTLIANRYRIVAQLGRGGMGEVFRAEDLILGQQVALKFLPQTATQNINLLTRFYDEVRIARQVTHPNVCRVYDIGEVAGQPYLSMQYIDGEDLGSLLRRIGRLPSDKAIEFARKLCAGLAAAHAQGVLHRDLKPGNIMVDARGQVLITDFGLAAIAEQLQGAEIRNGTPAYMAPEQLAGKEVSAQSDIYALGLVLYEMFTGKAAFEADTADEMLRLRQQSQIKNPSTVVNDLTPAVERVILRCLEPDPKMRPGSALAVAAALPGADALADALAAGVTPSPEVVAAAGSNEGLRFAVAIGALAGVAVLTALLCVLVTRNRAVNRIPMEYPPEALAAKARDLIKKLGYTDRPVDSAYSFSYDGDAIGFMNRKVKGRVEWDRVLASRPSPLTFAYRQSPRPLASISIHNDGRVDSGDPFPEISGMVSVELDPDGRLMSFHAVPPQLDTSVSPAVSTDWSALFSAGELDIGKFQPAAPQWVPLVSTDSRAAWTGTFPGRPELPVRIEAAAWHGKPVYFEIIWPWTKPTRMQPESMTLAQRASNVMMNLFVVGVIITAVIMARQNSMAGRGDHRGAVRLGLVAFALKLLCWALSAHHVASEAEQSSVGEALATALINGVLMWGLYLALEPWVRRYWPQTLITWSRVLSGQFRDPMVGRDLLFGVLFGLAYCLFLDGTNSYDFSPDGNFTVSNLLGMRYIVYGILNHIYSSLTTGPGFFLMIFLLRALLRKQWLAAAAFVLLWTIAKTPQNDAAVWLVAPFWIVIYGIIVVILMRFGLFALVVTLFLIDWVHQTLLTTDLGAWYAQSSIVTLVVLGGMALYGFWLSLGSRQLAGRSAS